MPETMDIDRTLCVRSEIMDTVRVIDKMRIHKRAYEKKNQQKVVIDAHVNLQPTLYTLTSTPTFAGAGDYLQAVAIERVFLAKNMQGFAFMSRVDAAKILTTFNWKEHAESSEKALVYLYNTLIDLKDRPDVCNEFIKYLSVDRTSVDAIVHILNSLSPIKDKLDYWRQFYEASKSALQKKVGISVTDSLLKVVI